MSNSKPYTINVIHPMAIETFITSPKPQIVIRTSTDASSDFLTRLTRPLAGTHPDEAIVIDSITHNYSGITYTIQ